MVQHYGSQGSRTATRRTTLTPGTNAAACGAQPPGADPSSPGFGGSRHADQGDLDANSTVGRANGRLLVPMSGYFVLPVRRENPLRVAGIGCLIDRPSITGGNMTRVALPTPTLHTARLRLRPFTAIPHQKLMQVIEERVVDQSVLKLLRQILRAGVMQDGQVRRGVIGAAQGGPISPLLCNIYLHRLDREWSEREHGVLVRFADDLLVMCKSRQQAEAALADPSGAGRARPRAEGSQDPHRSPGGWRPGVRFPGFPSPDGAVEGIADRQGNAVPRPLARRQGDAARPRPDP
jgi:hypothetical protein